jgi:transposase
LFGRFVPAVVDAAPSCAAGQPRRKTPSRQWDEPLSGTIEVAIDSVTVRIGPGAPADTIAAVLQALKAGA